MTKTRDTSALPSCLASRDLSSKIGQLISINHFAIHHSDQQLPYGAPIEVVDNTAQGSGGHVGARFESRIHIGSTLNAMPDIAFVFQPLEDRPGRRLLHEVSLLQCQPDFFGRG